MSTYLVLREWPRATARGARPRHDCTPYLDGQIHVVPRPDVYNSLKTLRSAIRAAAERQHVKVRMCTDAAYPDALIVQKVGVIE